LKTVNTLVRWPMIHNDLHSIAPGGPLVGAREKVRIKGDVT